MPLAPLTRKWADLLADDYLSATGSAAHGFVCPLCIGDVPVSCATVAHAPAKAIGGRPVTHLCRQCNNTMNKRFEQKSYPFFTAMKRMTLQVPGEHPAPGQYLVRPHGGGGLDIVFSHSDPASTAADRIRALARAGAVAGAFSVVETRPSPNIVKGAILSWVYLDIFRRLGYRAALSPLLDVPREHLLGRRQPILVVRTPPDVREHHLLFAWREPPSATSLTPVFLGWSFAGFTALWPTNAADSRAVVAAMRDGDQMGWREVAGAAKLLTTWGLHTAS